MTSNSRNSNGGKCQDQKTPKSLEVIIDGKLNYRDHSTKKKTRKQSEIGIKLGR